MKLHTGRFSHFRRRCMQRGISFDVARACFVGPVVDDRVTVDLDHPAYPRPPVVMPGPNLWDEIHRRPLLYQGDAKAERRYLWSVVDRLPRGCDCRSHWRRDLLRHPSPFISAAMLALWTFDRHLTVNRRLRKPGVRLVDAAEQYGWFVLKGLDVGRQPSIED